MRERETGPTVRMALMGIALAVVSLGVFGGVLAPSPVAAAVIEVDSDADNATANNDLCTLQEAIINANTDSDTTQGDCEAGTGVDQIVFAAGVTEIVLGAPLPPVTDAEGLTIEGASAVTVDGNDQVRPFYVSVGAVLILNGITITNGLVDADEFDDTQNGGGILNQGTLTLNNSVVSGNSVPGNGGGIHTPSDGVVNLNDSVVSNNEAGTDAAGNGGGLYLGGPGSLNLNRTSVINNAAGVDPLANAGSGGGVWASGGSVVLIDSTVSGNRAPGDGGGLRIGGSLTTTGSTISDNHADRDDDDEGDGGGVFSNGGTLVLTNSTVSGNSAARGGGIFNSNDEPGSITLTNVTIALNTSDPILGNSGIHNGGEATEVTIQNSLFVGNTVNCSGPVTSLGNNLSSDPTCVDGSVTGDLANNPNANIGPLQNNGGPTETHALLASSDAIDAGNDAVCQDAVTGSGPNDQRGEGFPRSEGASCDIGAYEVQLPGLTVTKLCVGEGFDATFEITVADATETAGCGDSVSAPNLAPGDYTVSETISGPDADAFATVIACDGGAPVEATSTTVTIPADAAVDVSCVIINFFDPDGGAPGEGPTALICLRCLDLEIDIDNGNTNTIGIDNDNTNNNDNDNANLNDNANSNENANGNENENTQDQDNAQDQDNTNEQDNNIDSSPDVNIDF